MDHIDAYAVFSPVTKEVYYVNKENLIGKKSGLNLRIVESKINDVRIKYAKNFKNVENLWKINLPGADDIC